MRDDIRDAKRQLIRTVCQDRIPTDQDPWFFLCADDNLDLFRELIANGIRPLDDDLSVAQSPESEYANAWHRLSCSEPGCEMLSELFMLKIYPDSKASSATGLHANPNVWFALISKQLFSMSDQLLNLDILPTSDALSVQSQSGEYEGMNSWTLLASSDEGIKRFNRLVVSKIVPTTSALTAQGKQNKQYAWLSLASNHDEGLDTFCMLLEADVVPSSADLSIIGIHKKSVWVLLLQGIEKELVVVYCLLKLGVVPSPDLLTSAIWRRLALPSDNNIISHQVFSELLDLNRKPAAEDLSADNGDGVCAWYWFAEYSVEVFNKLLSLGMIPSAEALSMQYAGTHDYKDAHAWFWLAARNSDVFFELIQSDIVPSRNAYYARVSLSEEKRVSTNDILAEKEGKQPRGLIDPRTSVRIIRNRVALIEDVFSDTRCSRAQATLWTSETVLPALYLLLIAQNRQACAMGFAIDFLVKPHQGEMIKRAFSHESYNAYMDKSAHFNLWRLLFLTMMHSCYSAIKAQHEKSEAQLNDSFSSESDRYSQEERDKLEMLQLRHRDELKQFETLYGSIRKVTKPVDAHDALMRAQQNSKTILSHYIQVGMRLFPAFQTQTTTESTVHANSENSYTPSYMKDRRGDGCALM